MNSSSCLYCGKELIYTGSRPRKWCDTSCRGKFRYKNDTSYQQRNTYEEQVKRSKARKLKAINLLGGSCSTCGQAHPAALSFHHIDPSIKKFNIDGRIFGNMKWSAIEEELSKCELLCHNCHSIRHNGAYWSAYI